MVQICGKQEEEEEDNGRITHNHDMRLGEFATQKGKSGKESGRMNGKLCEIYTIRYLMLSE